VRELPRDTGHRIADPAMCSWMEAMLAWNPRLVRVRPNAAKIATRLEAFSGQCLGADSMTAIICVVPYLEDLNPPKGF